jgi:hypothetical protein
MIYNNTGKMDRLLSNGHHLLSHIGHLKARIGPGTLRPCVPTDTPICNVCRCSSGVKNCKQPQVLPQPSMFDWVESNQPSLVKDLKTQ